MPADSEGVVTLPHTWRPFGVRMAGAVFGGFLIFMLVAMWVLLDPEIKAKIDWFQRGTALFLFALAFATGFALVRSRAVATDSGLTVVNGYRRRDFAWAQVVAINLPRGAPWASLDLADGETCPVMAIQGSDGDKARRAVREVRALLDRPSQP